MMSVGVVGEQLSGNSWQLAVGRVLLVEITRWTNPDPLISAPVLTAPAKRQTLNAERRTLNVER
jgi:hypothetical protein